MMEDACDLDAALSIVLLAFCLWCRLNFLAVFLFLVELCGAVI